MRVVFIVCYVYVDVDSVLQPLVGWWLKVVHTRLSVLALRPTDRNIFYQ